MLAESPAVIRALRRLYEVPELESAIRRWWRTTIVPQYPPRWRQFAIELYEFECWSRPRYIVPGSAAPTGWRSEELDGEQYYVSNPVTFSHDIAAMLRDTFDGAAAPATAPTWYAFEARAGFYLNADNHEIALGYKSRATRVDPTQRPKPLVDAAS